EHRGGDGGRGGGRSFEKGQRRRQGRDSRAGKYRQQDGRSAGVVRGRGDARGPRGGHGRQAGRPGRRAGRGGDVEGPHGQRQLHGEQPHESGAQHRGRDQGGGRGGPIEEDHRRGQGRDPRAQEHGQHHGRSAELFRGGGH